MNNEAKFSLRLVAFFGYLIPVIGWMIPLFFASKNETLQHHGRQGFLLVSLFLINAVFYYFMTRLIPIQYEIVEKIFWLMICAIYLVLTMVFAFRSLFSKNADMPLVARFSKELPL